jgi:uncharacterized protein with von Willebrand factor type A (vWA) domain
MAEPLRGVAPADLAAPFGRRLRAAGLPVTPERSARFARALLVVPPATRDALYWTARAVFVSGRDQAEPFDRVFAAVFDGRADPADSRGDPGAPPPADARYDGAPAPGAPSAGERPGAGGRPVPTAGASDADGPLREAPVAFASADERLADKPFAALEPQELAAIRRLMERLAFAPPTRISRRARRDRHGERIDVRRTLRAGRRTGGDPVRLARRRRRRVPRRLVLLCDVSGSMEPYARAYGHFLRAAVAGPGPAEAFVFATRLTRVTRALRGGDHEAALRRATAAAPDRAGGTRLGEALAAFNRRHGRRGVARGAVVVVLSDGWETGDPAAVGREMARLRRLAHRVIWVNPRAGAPGFVPRTGGMRAALPHCDALLPGHSLAALAEVAAAIGDARPSRRVPA